MNLAHDPSIREKWVKLDQEMLPLIKIRAKKIREFNGSVSFEDAVQEGRLALLSALLYYKEEEGELERYVNRVLYNKFYNMGMAITEESRQLSPERLPIDYVTASSCYLDTPEKIVSNIQSLELVVEYDNDLFDELDADEKKVYRSFIIPNINVMRKNLPKKFKRILSFLEGQKVTSKELGILLNTNKNGVDYRIRLIRKKALWLANTDKYRSLFYDLINTRKWLSIYLDK